MERKIDGTYNEDTFEVKIDVLGDDVLLAHSDNKQLLKISLRPLLDKLEKLIPKNEDLKSFLQKCEGCLSIKASFSVNISEPYSYGEDADGNRGVIRQDYEDVDSDSFHFQELKLFLFDEDGYNLNKSDDCFMDLDHISNSSDTDELKNAIIEIVNNAPEDYTK